MSQDVSHLPYPDGPARTFQEKIKSICGQYKDGCITYEDLKNHAAVQLSDLHSIEAIYEFSKILTKELELNV